MGCGFCAVVPAAQADAAVELLGAPAPGRRADRLGDRRRGPRDGPRARPHLRRLGARRQGGGASGADRAGGRRRWSCSRAGIRAPPGSGGDPATRIACSRAAALGGHLRPSLDLGAPSPVAPLVVVGLLAGAGAGHAAVLLLLLPVVLRRLDVRRRARRTAPPCRRARTRPRPRCSSCPSIVPLPGRGVLRLGSLFQLLPQIARAVGAALVLLRLGLLVGVRRPARAPGAPARSARAAAPRSSDRARSRGYPVACAPAAAR